MLSIRNLHFSYKEQPILTGINIDVPRGKITAIIGPSGCGKTTLLRLIGGQLQPQRGTIQFNDIVINRLAQSKLYHFLQKIGVLFQNAALFNQLNSFENVVFPLREHAQLPEAIIHCLGLMKLQAVGLRGAANLMPNQLSGGMARRVALARAIALDPELILYDEPFAGLDPIALGIIVKLITELNTALGMTTVVISHHVNEIIKLADYIYVIAAGRIIGQGSAHFLQTDPNPEVQQFLQGLPDGIVAFHYAAKDYSEDLFDQ